MSDIVERLRAMARLRADTGPTATTASEAADEIERLRRSNGALAIALHEHASTPACSLKGRRKRWWRRASGR